MARVLEECQHVGADFSGDPVHDLRVSLRRCRSMADGMAAMDPDRDWKAMKKAGKRLFQRLGALRDVQVMMEWVETLHPGAGEAAAVASPDLSAETGSAGESPTPTRTMGDPAARTLLEILRGREIEQKREAQAALEGVDGKQGRPGGQSV